MDPLRPSSGQVGAFENKSLVATVVVLLIVATIYWYQSPLHYLLNFDARGFSRYWPNRGWLLGHILGATFALFLGPFQFWNGLKMRRPKLHRRLGYGYAFGILIGGASSFVLSVRSPIPDFGFSLFFLGFAWWLTLGVALTAIRNRRFDTHRDWMIRSYVVTFGFVTFRLMQDTHLLDGLGRARLSSSAWVCWAVPLLVAEVFLQRKAIGPRRPPPPLPSRVSAAALPGAETPPH